ncbi:hypothetical protein TNCT_101561 [Trichonephila clavata]|uniref:Uncharacterized protein n=1 Tax=Trichonephila clavata TaxID=2740835 RepID=A0A8X6GZC7_TRICU|nr:hypothetical protein TNCT_101561 [Trichonephila clavata]
MRFDRVTASSPCPLNTHFHIFSPSTPQEQKSQLDTLGRLQARFDDTTPRGRGGCDLFAERARRLVKPTANEYRKTGPIQKSMYSIFRTLSQVGTRGPDAHIHMHAPNEDSLGTRRHVGNCTTRAVLP